MRLIELLVVLIFFGLVNAISFNLTYSNGTIMGEPGAQKTLVIEVRNTGQGGILVYHIKSQTDKELISNCINPGASSQLPIPLSLQKGQGSITISMVLMDFWRLIGGNMCNQLSPKTYDFAQSQAYSMTSQQIILNSLSGCQYGYPVCSSDHNCQNNNCVLKLGCAYSNPPCDDSRDCRDNVCILKPGCSYNNPPCNDGYVCENNLCIAVITEQNRANSIIRIGVVENKLSQIDTDLNDLIGIYQKLGNTEKIQYLNSIKIFVSRTSLNLSSIKNSIVVGQKKDIIVLKVIQSLNSIEEKRASLRNQNPQIFQINPDDYGTLSQPPPQMPISNPKDNSPKSNPPQITSLSQLSLERVQLLVNTFPELQKIDLGRTITLMVRTNDGETKSYYIGKTNVGFVVMESEQDTDIALSMDEDTFLQLLNSSNKCSTLKTLTETSISAVPLADRQTLLGFCKLKNCISDTAVPEISACWW